MRRVLPWVIGVLLTGLFAFSLVRPIGDLMGLPQLGLGLSPQGWFWLIAAVALPAIVFALSVWLPRKKTRAVRLTVLAAGLAVLALLQLEMQLLLPVSEYFAS